MVVIRHKFLDWRIDSKAEIIFIGTFNPETSSNDFFYGSGHNFLWKLLPLAFEEEPLKTKQKGDKIEFMKSRRIDFVDVVAAVDVEKGKESNRSDKYIDKRVVEWRDVIGELANARVLKRVYFTRRRSSEVKNIGERFAAIESYLADRGVPFASIASPSRYWNEDKQLKWNALLRGYV